MVVVITSKRKTNEEYIREIQQLNPNIEVVGEYHQANEKILHRCKLDGYEWYATPHNILRGRGCPKCSNHINITPDEYRKRVSNVNNNIVVIGKYVNRNTKITHKCIKHNYEWDALPSNILGGHGCPMCQREALSKQKSRSNKEYIKLLEQKNIPIDVLENYVNAHKNILHRCRICGYEWKPKPYNVLNNKGCPHCKNSKGEKAVANWLKEHRIEYVVQKKFDNCRYIKPLPFDFYLPNYNICIEFQGEQHYKSIEYFGGNREFNKRIIRDEIKRKFCKTNNIILLEVKYDDIIDEKLKSFLFI